MLQGYPEAHQGRLLAAPCESLAVRMVVLWCVFEGLQRKHAFRLHESSIQLPASPIGLSRSLSRAQRVHAEEAKSELSCRPQVNFHVFSLSVEKVHLLTFWPPCESPGGPQDEFFGPEGACTAPSGGHKGDPLGAESSSRVDETHSFAEAQKS